MDRAYLERLLGQGALAGRDGQAGGHARIDGGLLGERTRTEGGQPRQGRSSRQARQAESRTAREQRLVDRADRAVTRAQQGERQALAGAVRVERPPRQSVAPGAGPAAQASAAVSPPRPDELSSGARAATGAEVPRGGGQSAQAKGQAGARRRGGRSMPAMRLRSLSRLPGVPPHRALTEALCAQRPRCHALAPSGSIGGSEVHPALCKLPRGGGGRHALGYVDSESLLRA